LITSAHDLCETYHSSWPTGHLVADGNAT